MVDEHKHKEEGKESISKIKRQFGLSRRRRFLEWERSVAERGPERQGDTDRGRIHTKRKQLRAKEPLPEEYPWGDTVRSSDIIGKTTNQGQGDQRPAPRPEDPSQRSHLRPEPSMGCRLLCCAVLCLLGAAPMETGVTQTPRHLVMGMTNKKSLKCEQDLGHNAMYWYKQSAEKPLQLMFVYNLKEQIENNSVPSRFSPECPNSSHLFLHLHALQPEDSVLYLCASSQDTALQSHRFPVQKALGPSRKPWGPPKPWVNISCKIPDRSFRTS
ncbi:uncharacterized protein LOC101176031 [Nomascus leucogenys]|uniref:uncharacterized protein LOC101176031 n=1 Tax=Nomascus leucogenys TaxID=61853 RepID=UPI00122D973F|nr:uncharacterized protein LOC101176031 [Nomascus leucogenys]